jgi:hypothetical protein
MFKSLGFGGRLEHLPVGGNQCFTRHFSGFLKPILADGFRGPGDGGHRGGKDEQ